MYVQDWYSCILRRIDFRLSEELPHWFYIAYLSLHAHQQWMCLPLTSNPLYRSFSVPTKHVYSLLILVHILMVPCSSRYFFWYQEVKGNFPILFLSCSEYLVFVKVFDPSGIYFEAGWHLWIYMDSLTRSHVVWWALFVEDIVCCFCVYFWHLYQKLGVYCCVSLCLGSSIQSHWSNCLLVYQYHGGFF